MIRAFLIVAFVGGIAHADVDHLADGQTLASRGQYLDAIAEFKRGHLAEPTRSEPECLISLAYRRLERWGQAQLFLTRCLGFAARPDWVPQLSADIEAGIAHATIVPVTFAITPAVDVTVSVGSFAPDETFAPQPIYLEPGAQVLSLVAQGYKPQRLTLELTAAAPYVVKAALEPQATLRPDVAVPPPETHERARSHRGLYVLAGSGVVLAVGAVSYVLASGTASDAMKDRYTRDHVIGTFKLERAVAYSAGAAGAIGVGIGAWLYLHHRDSESRVARRWLAPAVTGAAAALLYGGSW